MRDERSKVRHLRRPAYRIGHSSDDRGMTEGWGGRIPSLAGSDAN
jgi:hypothetical protein